MILALLNSILFPCIHSSFLWSHIERVYTLYKYRLNVFTWRWLSSLQGFNFMFFKEWLIFIHTGGEENWYSREHSRRFWEAQISAWLLMCCSVFTDNYLTLWQWLRQWWSTRTIPTLCLLIKSNEQSTWGYIQKFHTRRELFLEHSQRRTALAFQKCVAPWHVTWQKYGSFLN